MRIEEIDSNIYAGSNIDTENTNFCSATEPPFSWHGCYQHGVDGQLAHRIPPTIAESISDNMAWLNKTHPGVRVAFSTDSAFVSFSVESRGYGRTVDDAFSGSTGIFITASEEGRAQNYKGRISPTFSDLYDEMSGKGAKFSGTVKLGNKKMRQIIAWLPNLTDYRKLYIGVEKGSVLGEFEGYRYKTPVVFYGSSITMGVGSSAPCNSYPALISRTLDTDFVNLGFSGNALGEPEIAEYIASLNMSAFVYDYDHNAPTVEHLAATHEKFFKIIREKQPDLPIIIMSRTDYPEALDTAQRYDVILNTFMNAKEAGDNKVWLINGANVFTDDYRDCCTHENCHPNDLGYMYMAKAVSELLKEHLK
ncbi:MAG: SGNH/GDSL hydrolase family protein [Acutalibacteraceae bacterium]|nr:SGNH/GDSL hydrolase family protein [Acutalibacteraceae bacterium]